MTQTYDLLPRPMTPDFGIFNQFDPFYNGYDESLNPQLSNEFMGAGFRFGHSLITGELP